MSEIEITEKPLPAVRLAALTETVATQPEVAGVVGPLFDRVADALAPAGASLATPIAEYDMDENGVRITAGFVYDGPALDGIDIVELPAAASAVTGLHLGEMATIDRSWQALYDAITVRGAHAEGPCREVYVRAESEDQLDWITELQQPVVS
ncbi:MAG: GyrI-like domain-containing protein [Candidatus Microbacterium colombiense]|nr:MAG: GyrI-like domain-containing protein [Microbacterium sp.]